MSHTSATCGLKTSYNWGLTGLSNHATIIIGQGVAGDVNSTRTSPHTALAVKE